MRCAWLMKSYACNDYKHIFICTYIIHTCFDAPTVRVCERENGERERERGPAGKPEWKRRNGEGRKGGINASKRQSNNV